MRTLACATALLAASAADAFVAPSAKLVVQRSFSGSSRRLAPMMARKPFIAGNWKLNPATVDEATSLAKAVRACVRACVRVPVGKSGRARASDRPLSCVGSSQPRLLSPCIHACVHACL